jgi:hypothetical protein
MSNLTKVAELKGEALDWAVSVCEDLPLKLDPMGFKTGSEAGYWVWDESNGKLKSEKVGRDYSPSSMWSQGGPIIENYKISVSISKTPNTELWCANANISDQGDTSYAMYGNNALVAVMRYYVRSCLGVEIELPDAVMH